MTGSRRTSTLEQRLARLEKAVKALGAAPRPKREAAGRISGAGSVEADVLALLQRRASRARSNARGEGVYLVGALLRAGERQYADVRFLDAVDSLDASSESMATLLAAISSAARITLLRHLAAQDATRTELLTLLGAPSVGQLYHHLNALQRAGLVTQPRRGVFRLPPDRVIPVFTLLALAHALAQGAPPSAAPINP